MKRSTGIIILVLVSVGLALTGPRAQDPERYLDIEIPDFSPGLVTAKTARQMQPGEAVVCHDADLNRFPGGFGPRLGYDSLFTIAGQDSFLWNGLYTVPWPDGSKELLLVLDSTGVGWANLYATQKNSLDLSQIDSFFLTPDVALASDSAAAAGNDSVTWHVRVTVGTAYGVGFQCLRSMSAANVVDSLAARINASGASAYVTASGDADTLVIAENSADLDAVITYWATVTNSIRTYFAYSQTWVNSQVKDAATSDSVKYVFWWLEDGADNYETDTVATDTTTLTTVQVVDSLAALAIALSSQVDVDTTIHTDSTVVLRWNGVALLDGGFDVFDKWAGGWQPITFDPTYTPWTSGTGGVDTVSNAWAYQVRSNGTPRRIGSYLAATGWPQYDMYRSKLFLVNGVGRGVVYDGRNTKPFPAQASGEILAVPLTEAGTLDGRYRYCLRAVNDSIVVADTLIVGRLGYLTQPVLVDSGKILLRAFPRRHYDKHYSGADSVTYEIWRSVGEIGKLDKLDSVFNTGLTVHVDSVNFDTVTVVDTVSDVTLRTHPGRVYEDGELYRFGNDTADTATRYSAGEYQYFRRPGAPSLLSWSSLASRGIWQDGADTSSSIDWRVCAGYAIMLVAVDTVQNIPSDSGVSLNFYQNYDVEGIAASYYDSLNYFSISRGGMEKLQYVLPRPADTNIVYLVYRAPLIPTQIDSGKYWMPGDPWVYDRYSGTYYYSSEQKALQYFFIGQFNPGDTVSDTLHYDSLIVREPYIRNAVPAIGTAIATLDNRLFISDGSHTSYSNKADSNTSFLTFDQIAASPDDGDQIAAMWQAAQKTARIGKSQSMFNAYQAADGKYQSAELSRHYGVIAPLSHAKAPEGDYFLSADGVRVEDEGPYRDRAFVGQPMSSRINSFQRLPAQTLRGAVGSYFDDKFLLSFPGLDTTWVLFKIPRGDGYRYSWGTWSLTFAGTAMYSVTTSNVHLPSDSVYFIKSGSASLYRYGSSQTDNGTPIVVRWESGPLGPMDGQLYEPVETGLWTQSPDTIAGDLTADFLDDRYDTTANRFGRVDSGKRVTFGALRDWRYHRYEVGTGALANDALYWSVRLTGTGLPGGLDGTIVEGMNVRFHIRGSAQRR